MSKVKKVTRSASPDSSEDSDDSDLHKHVNSLRSIMTPDRDFSKSRPFYAERSRTMDVSSVMAIQEHARPRQGSSSSRYVGKVYSLTTSIERFRSEFDDMKQKMAIFGESLNLCKCIAVDFNTRVSQLEKRLDNLERRQCSKSQSNNYSHIIKKNKELSTKTLNEAKGAPARVLPFHPDKPYQDGLVEPELTRRLPDFAPQKLQMCGTEDEMREVAGRICRNYLPGAWKTVGPTDLQFHRISGGLSNFLYFVALPEDLTKVKLRETTSEEDVNHSANMLAKNSYIAEEPKQVLIRIYGQVHGERAMDAIVTESVIFTLLSERKLGPKLYGVFSGGRIEEYIPARPLITKELSEPALSMKIAEKMAAIHSMDIPLSKEPSWLWKTLSKWLKTVKEERLTSNGKGKDEEEARLIKRMNSVDYGKEIEWLKKFLEGVESPAVFCHNDMQEGNILFLEDHSMEEDVSYRVFSEDNPRKSFDLSYEESTVDSVSSNLSDLGEPKLYLIDFEYCSYNYRGFDIANHFQEWAYNYTNPEYPYFYETPEDWPTLEQKEIFIREYLKHFNTNANDGKHTLPTIDEVNHLLNEVDAFALASHLFWSLWSIINASKSQIPFGYWNYGVARLDTYLRLKQEVVKKDKFGPQKRKICEVDI